MEEKKSLKISLSTFFLILAIIVIIIMAYYIYITKKESNKEIDDLKENAIGMQSTITNLRAKINNTTRPVNITIPDANTTNTIAKSTTTNSSLDLGTYTIDGVQVDSSDGSGISIITLSENNKFVIDLVYSGRYTGTYVIENNTLTCNASKEEIYAGGTSIKDTNAIFEFKIINNNNIEFDTTQNISDKFELNKNFSYSVK